MTTAAINPGNTVGGGVIAGISDFITGDLTEWVNDVIDAIGYFGVAFLVALENVFPPIPSEVVLPAAGIWASERGSVVELIAMIVAATIGSVIGAWALYGVGAAYGETRIRAFVAKNGKWFGVSEADLDKADAWFNDRQEAAVLVCRCVPLLRSLVSVPAGIRKMDPLRFTLYTTLGSLVWNGALISLGYFGSAHIDTVADAIEKVQYLVVGVILIGLVWFVWARIIRPRRSGSGGSAAE